MQCRFLGLAAVFAAAMSVPVMAHHSHANYQQAEFTFVEGVVKEVHLINPHSWVYVEVKNAQGEPELWALEATGPQGLKRNGITEETVKPGDTIKARCHRLVDGTNGCLLGFLTPMHGDAARGHGVEKTWD